jgi:hypothetical protein
VTRFRCPRHDLVPEQLVLRALEASTATTESTTTESTR